MSSSMATTTLAGRLLWLHLLCCCLYSPAHGILSTQHDSGYECYYPNEASRYCYTIPPGRYTWEDGFFQCQHSGGAMMQTRGEYTMDAVKQIMTSRSIPKTWMGAFKETLEDWKWLSKDQTGVGAYSAWMEGHPLPRHTLTECVAMVKEDFYWEDKPCSYKLGYICQTARFSERCRNAGNRYEEVLTLADSCYAIKSGEVSWFVAQQQCWRDGMQLATIDSAAVQQMIVQARPGSGHMVNGFWIGLNKVRWVWLNRTPIGTTHWATGQPTGEGACITLERSAGSGEYKWNDDICSDYLPYMCQYERTKPGTTVTNGDTKTTTNPITTTTTTKEPTTTIATTTTTRATTPSGPDTTTTEQRRTPPPTPPGLETTTTASSGIATTPSTSSATTTASQKGTTLPPTPPGLETTTTASSGIVTTSSATTTTTSQARTTTTPPGLQTTTATTILVQDTTTTTGTKTTTTTTARDKTTSSPPSRTTTQPPTTPPGLGTTTTPATASSTTTPAIGPTTTTPPSKTTTAATASPGGGNQPSPPVTQPSADICHPIDVAFLLDSSDSVGEENWQRLKYFVLGIVRDLRIDPDCFQVAVLSYGDDVDVAMYLDDFSTYDEIQKAMTKMPWRREGTNTPDALKALYTDIFLGSKGDRSFAPNVGVLMTDGRTTQEFDPERAIPEAEIVKERGTEMFAFGIGALVEVEELYGIASEPEDQHVFLVDTYTRLPMFKDVLIDMMQAIETSPPPTTGAAGATTPSSSSSSSSPSVSSTTTPPPPPTASPSSITTSDSSGLQTTTAPPPVTTTTTSASVTTTALPPPAPTTRTESVDPPRSTGEVVTSTGTEEGSNVTPDPAAGEADRMRTTIAIVSTTLILLVLVIVICAAIVMRKRKPVEESKPQMEQKLATIEEEDNEFNEEIFSY